MVALIVLLKELDEGSSIDSTDNNKVEISNRGINCFWLFATTSETTRAHADHGTVLALLAEASC